MKPVPQNDFKIAKFLRAALAHRMSFFHALVVQPTYRFENAEDFRIMLLCQFDAIGEVVAVRMRNKDRVEPREFFKLFRRRWIVHHEGINEPDLPARSRQRKSGVAEAGNLVAFSVEHEPTSVGI